LPNLGVNRRVCLCDVASYVSAQTLDFLDLGQKSAFLDWKHYLVPKLIITDLWTGTSYLLFVEKAEKLLSELKGGIKTSSNFI
jgi:hypothetical protein